METVYILECKNGKYYVGKTNNLELRLNQHFSNVGCEWTKIYPPIKLIEKYEKCDGYDEDKYTLKTMEKYGIDNVRGGSWTTIMLSLDEQELIKKRILSAQNRCYKCGKTGHFIKDCIGSPGSFQKVQIKGLSSHPEYNDKLGTIKCWCETRMRWLVDIGEKDLYIKDINIWNPEPPSFPYGSCYRCGRRNHYAQNCYARKDVIGNDIWW